MAASFLFYDVETSGVNPREARVMQFAAQRTDEALQPTGEPYNYLIKLSPDVLPDPEAILITGITPQKTIAEGITEAEFLKIFHQEIAAPDTTFVGFNSIRFDDEFMRHLQFRNFYDPYEWSWKDGRSRWDMLDVVRMTRALRPDGITWPFATDGSPTNRLELLTDVNKLSHESAHDALSDVQATIDVARLIKQMQPKLYEYLLSMRQKRPVAELITSDEPFVYTSGRYNADFEKTTVAVRLADDPEQSGAALVFDLRFDPADYVDKTPEAIVEAWRLPRESRAFDIPVKQIRYNRCPAVAPLGVLEDASQKRLELDTATIAKRLQIFRKQQKKLAEIFGAAYQQLRSGDQQAFAQSDGAPDGRLYDGFIPDSDKPIMRQVRSAKPDKLSSFTFSDERLNQLLPLYKARNFMEYLSADEHAAWEAHRKRALLDGGDDSKFQQFARQLQAASERYKDQPDKQYLLEEIQLYAESIAPIDE